jgi:hypothetical protein
MAPLPLPDLAAEVLPAATILPEAAPLAAADLERPAAPAPQLALRLPKGRNLPPQGAPLPPARGVEAVVPQAVAGTPLMSPATPVTQADAAAAPAVQVPTAPMTVSAATPISATDPETPVFTPVPVAPVLVDAVSGSSAASPKPRTVTALAPASSDDGSAEPAPAFRPAAPATAPLAARPVTLSRVLPAPLPGETVIAGPVPSARAPVPTRSILSGDDHGEASGPPEPAPDALAVSPLPVALAVPIAPQPVAAPPLPLIPAEPAAATPVIVSPDARWPAPVSGASDPVLAPLPSPSPSPFPSRSASAPAPLAGDPGPAVAQVAAEAAALAAAPLTAPPTRAASGQAKDALAASTIPLLPGPVTAQAASVTAPVVDPRGATFAPPAPPPQPPAASTPAADPSLRESRAAARPDKAAGDDPAAPQLASAAPPTPSPPPLLAAASAPPVPADRADPRSAAPPPPAPQQQSTIDQVGDLREALRAQRPAMMLLHAEFGAVALRLEPGRAPEGWHAVLASRDPGFVPAIQAALAERVVAANTAAPDSGGQQSGAFHHNTGEPRSGSSPNGGQGSPQPYLGQSGSRDGEAAPDHRRPSTTAALAARLEAEKGGSGGPASPAGGLFA